MGCEAGFIGLSEERGGKKKRKEKGEKSD